MESTIHTYDLRLLQNFCLQQSIKKSLGKTWWISKPYDNHYGMNIWQNMMNIYPKNSNIGKTWWIFFGTTPQDGTPLKCWWWKLYRCSKIVGVFGESLLSPSDWSLFEANKQKNGGACRLWPSMINSLHHALGGFKGFRDISSTVT